MYLNISKKISEDFKNFKIDKIESGASNKIFYKLWDEFNSYILVDFNCNPDEYNNYIKIYEILIKINISIPKIIHKYDHEFIIICENFGNLRFDNILKDYKLKDLLNYAVETLIVLNNSIEFNKTYNIPQYNYEEFKSEIMELPEYYFPYIKIENKDLIEEFLYVWQSAFNNIEFEFKNFIHKDFNINNLILLPTKKNHLKCGVIDFQSAFWGENSWDLFSLLEDSRKLFSDAHNEYFIKYFYSKTSNQAKFKEFINKYYFLSSSRHTRLLGRWVKLARDLDQKWYLDFINPTLHRLKKNINLSNNKNLINFYNKFIFNL